MQAVYSTTCKRFESSRETQLVEAAALVKHTHDAWRTRNTRENKKAYDEAESAYHRLEANDPLEDYTTRAIPHLNRLYVAQATMESQKRDATERGRSIKEISRQWDETYRVLSRAFFVDLHPELVESHDRKTQTQSKGPSQACVDCGRRNHVIDRKEAKRVCLDCGLAVAHQVSEASFEHIQHTTPPRQFKYQRINHLREYLRQIMAAQQRPPPAEVERLVRDELWKRRAYIAQENVNPAVVRSVLHDCKQSRYFKYATSLAVRINPRFKAPSIEQEHTERVMYLFVCTEGPYEQIKQKVKCTRKNYMSYAYTCYQLCYLCGFHQYLPLFPPLKSTSLRQQQDEFWRAVCQALRWPFYPTVGNVVRAVNFAEAAAGDGDPAVGGPVIDFSGAAVSGDVEEEGERNEDGGDDDVDDKAGNEEVNDAEEQEEDEECKFEQSALGDEQR